MNYWYKYYNDQKIVGHESYQQNVGRTKNGTPITNDLWKKTLSYIYNICNINKHSNVLEICCGNGAIIGEFSNKCKIACGVDYSTLLLKQLVQKYPLVEVENNNVFDFNTSRKFSVIIFYFALQHFTERECLLLLEKYFSVLEPHGVFYIGDIPNSAKKWSYINHESHKKDYIQRTMDETPLIGNWYDIDFFKSLNYYYTDFKFEIFEQPSYQINSDWRFDVIISRK